MSSIVSIHSASSIARFHLPDAARNRPTHGQISQRRDKIQLPSTYTGPYSAKLEELSGRLNDLLPNQSISAARQAMQLFTNLHSQLQARFQCDHVTRVVRSGELQSRIQEVWKKALDEDEIIPYDLDSLFPSIHAAVQSKSAFEQKARTLRGLEAEQFMNVLYSFIVERTSDPLRDNVVKLLHNISNEAGALPSNLVLEGISLTPNTPKASGGYGDVLRGTYRGRNVAVKLLKGGGTGIYQSIYRREALIWASLLHPNVAEFMGVSKEHPLSFVSPYLPWNLEEYLTNAHHLVDKEDLIVQICRGVEYLHSQVPAVVHGDICPRNILIDEAGVPKFTDYGLSRIMHIISRTNTIDKQAGLLSYMSPELLEPDRSALGIIRPTPESDIWSLGLVIWRILTSLEPFAECRTNAATMLAIGTFSDIKQLSTRDVSLDLGHHLKIIQACLHPEYSKRAAIRDILASLNGDLSMNALITPEPYEIVRHVNRELVGYIVGTAKTHKGRLEKKFSINIRIASGIRHPNRFSCFILSGQETNVRGAWLEIQQRIQRKAPKEHGRLDLPEKFKLSDDVKKEAEQAYGVSIHTDLDHRVLWIIGPEAFVNDATAFIEPIVQTFKETHGTIKLSIPPQIAQRLLAHDQRQEKILSSFRLPFLRDDLQVQIDIEEGGYVCISGLTGRLDHAKAKLLQVVNLLKREKRETFTWPEDWATALQPVIPDIIKNCNGPLNVEDQGILIQRVSPVTYVLWGQPELVDAMYRYILSFEWWNKMHISNQPIYVEAWHWGPLVNPTPLGQEHLRDFARSSKVDVRLTETPGSGGNYIILEGPRDGCKFVESEIIARIQLIRFAQQTIEIPVAFATEDLRRELIMQTRTVVDDKSLATTNARTARWVLTSKDRESLGIAIDHVRSFVKQSTSRPMAAVTHPTFPLHQNWDL